MWWPAHTTHCSNDYNMAASLLLWRWVGRNIGTPLHAVTKSPTPSNLIGSMMILRVLPIHVPPCYEGDTLTLLHWNHIWPMMIITPHLSSGGNARTRATVPTHKKSHNPHPRGGGGKYITLGGAGGPAKPGSYGIPFHAVTKSLLHLTW